MKKITLIISMIISIQVYADEGMWMLGNLNKDTRKAMKELGLKLSANELYSTKKPSLKDAVVSFGGFCSGVVVSDDGLVFTNHHCGFSAIQQHSSVEHDYLRDGFIAGNRSEELPNPELFVRFLLSIENVTHRVLSGINDTMTENERQTAIDSIRYVIQDEVYAKDSTLAAMVDPYYGGNEFWLSVYEDYNDVRLVFAPPSSIGKFGWDTDNWVWPRHTGDFSVFRIYANKENKPADYSPDNVPYRPKYVARISVDGYREGSFCMTMGYPGMTDRYLTSFGIIERMETINRAMIDVRGVKQAIWKREMERSDEIRIKYASKYDESSNYWKNSIGTNKAIKDLKIIEKKEAMETSLKRWIQNNPAERGRLLHLFSDLELAYKERKETARAMSYFGESFANGPEIVQLALEILNFDFEAEEKNVLGNVRKILEKYADLDPDIDKEVFAAMIEEYRNQVDSVFLPEFYNRIAAEYSGNIGAFVDSLYSRSKITTPLGLKLLVEQDTTYNFTEDPAVVVALDILVTAFDLNQAVIGATERIEQGERLYNAAIRRMYADRNFYPDANSTMRLSLGTVRGYNPFDGAEYYHYTTTQGILEKTVAHAGDRDFEVQPEIVSMLANGNFGRYADKNGEMNVCFISDNDITGGNSGSAMFNEKGELLGLAFDGNWEAMSSDLLYDPALQRCIGVDVRYMLYVMDKIGGAAHLINELKLRN